jgi:hypothetical protein
MVRQIGWVIGVSTKVHNLVPFGAQQLLDFFLEGSTGVVARHCNKHLSS